MSLWARCIGIVLCLLALSGAVAGGSAAYLAQVQDQYHQALDVYADANAGGNHFLHRSMLFDPASSYRPAPMTEDVTSGQAAGLSCIRATFGGTAATWGGWYFANGVLQGDATEPGENLGTVPNAGLDLSGATTLRFRARGAQGGERVEFFALGVGRNAATGAPIAPYPDSSAKASTGYVTLTPGWKQYAIDLSGRDLSYVLGGFGWVSSTAQNGGAPIVFYIDEVRYDLPRLDAPRFLRSYRTANSGLEFDLVMANTAYSYDNAVALIALLATGGEDGKRRAGLIADAFVYAQEHDRAFSDGRVRNAYAAGDLALGPGWIPHGRAGTARMPGWWSAGGSGWHEDAVQVGTYAGNAAWVGLALLAYHGESGDPRYLDGAERLGDWVLSHCADGANDGFTAGYEGWEPAQVRLTYRSTEHNMDLAALYARLYALTGEPRWLDAEKSATAFVLSMWDPALGAFRPGTEADGVTVNTAFVPVDVQAWAAQAVGGSVPPAELAGAVGFAETECRVGQGYDFDTDRDGVWTEGTAQMAVTHGLLGNGARAGEVVGYLHALRNADDSIDAATVDGLTTGLYLSSGPWLYYRQPHVGATGWLLLAESGTNPFLYGAGAVVTVPGGAGVPTDTDGDGLYDDVNGNRGRDFADIILYFNQMAWIAASEPVRVFDYNANGAIDFADIIWLFNHL